MEEPRAQGRHSFVVPGGLPRLRDPAGISASPTDSGCAGGGAPEAARSTALPHGVGRLPGPFWRRHGARGPSKLGTGSPLSSAFTPGSSSPGAASTGSVWHPVQSILVDRMRQTGLPASCGRRVFDGLFQGVGQWGPGCPPRSAGPPAGAAGVSPPGSTSSAVGIVSGPDSSGLTCQREALGRAITGCLLTPPLPRRVGGSRASAGLDYRPLVHAHPNCPNLPRVSPRGCRPEITGSDETVRTPRLIPAGRPRSSTEMSTGPGPPGSNEIRGYHP